MSTTDGLIIFPSLVTIAVGDPIAGKSSDIPSTPFDVSEAEDL